MAKKSFNLLTTVKSNEVSLCSKYNSGANKQTEFEIVKDEQGAIDRNMKPVVKELVKFMEFYEPVCEAEENTDLDSFKEFLEYWMEYDINNTYYSLLSEALQSVMSNIRYADVSKEEKVNRYKELFDMFISEYQSLPITKTQDGKFQVSLVSDSHIKETETNPQNETDVITKEKTNKMEKQNMFEQAIDLLKNAFGLEKTETPADEQPEEQTEVAVETETEKEVEVKAEENAEKEVETQAVEEENEAESKEVEVESPVVEAEVEVKEGEQPEVKENLETEVEALVKAKLEVEKELEELKKSQAEKEIEIEKMSFVQKAKDEYSMLVGTPEEIGEKLYSISKSNLGEEIKSFVMEQLKKVAEVNEELTTEVGSITKNAGDMTEEEIIYAKAEELSKTKNISLNKALREISK